MKEFTCELMKADDVSANGRVYRKNVIYDALQNVTLPIVSKDYDFIADSLYFDESDNTLKCSGYIKEDFKRDDVYLVPCMYIKGKDNADGNFEVDEMRLASLSLTTKPAFDIDPIS